MDQLARYAKRIKDRDGDRKGAPVVLVVVIAVGAKGNSALERLPVERPGMREKARGTKKRNEYRSPGDLNRVFHDDAHFYVSMFSSRLRLLTFLILMKSGVPGKGFSQREGMVVTDCSMMYTFSVVSIRN